MSAVRKCLGSLILQQTWSPRGLRNLRALGKGINLRPRSSGRSWFVRHCAFAAFPALRGHSEPGCPDWSPQSQPGTRAIVNASRSLRHRSTGLLEAWLFLMYYMQFAHHTRSELRIREVAWGWQYGNTRARAVALQAVPTCSPQVSRWRSSGPGVNVEDEDMKIPNQDRHGALTCWAWDSSQPQRANLFGHMLKTLWKRKTKQKKSGSQPLHK